MHFAPDIFWELQVVLSVLTFALALIDFLETVNGHFHFQDQVKFKVFLNKPHAYFVTD